MTEFAMQECKAKGLAWTKFEKDGTVQGGISKFITEEVKQELITKYNVENEDAIFFIADEKLEKTQKIDFLIQPRNNLQNNPTTMQTLTYPHFSH